MRMTLVVATATALVGTFVACGSNPPPPPTQPTGPVPVSLRVDGPSSIAPGSTGQFTATEVFNDGSTADVTASASWSSTSAALKFGPVPGQAQALNRGEAGVQALFFVRATTLRSPVLTVYLLEPGTFRVSGKVTEGATGLENGLVEVLTGTGAGLKTNTRFDGTYTLYGVAGPVELQATSEGYDAQVQSLDVTAATTANFNLTPTHPSSDISGPWTMTLYASPGCAGNLPEDARQRSFSVTIAQDGTHFTLSASGDLVRPLKESGRILDQSFSLVLFDESYYGFPDYDLFELLSPTRWLGIEGAVNATASGFIVEGTLAGAFHYFETKTGQKAPAFPELAKCAGPDGAFVLRRN